MALQTLQKGEHILYYSNDVFRNKVQNWLFAFILVIREPTLTFWKLRAFSFQISFIYLSTKQWDILSFPIFHHQQHPYADTRNVKMSMLWAIQNEESYIFTQIYMARPGQDNLSSYMAVIPETQPRVPKCYREHYGRKR